MKKEAAEKEVEKEDNIKATAKRRVLEKEAERKARSESKVNYNDYNYEMTCDILQWPVKFETDKKEIVVSSTLFEGQKIRHTIIVSKTDFEGGKYWATSGSLDDSFLTKIFLDFENKIYREVITDSDGTVSTDKSYTCLVDDNTIINKHGVIIYD